MANTHELVLAALKYGSAWTNADADVGNENFRKLVAWIEDTKVGGAGAPAFELLSAPTHTPSWFLSILPCEFLLRLTRSPRLLILVDWLSG